MKRIKALDGLRGIAIILVVFFHYFACRAQPDDSVLFRFLGAAFFQGWNGVDLFFVLSGFLIVGLLRQARGSQNFFTTFYVRRVCRILPLYYLMVVLFFLQSRIAPTAIPWLFDDGLPWWSYVTLTQNFFMHAQGFGANWLGVSWSLAIEEQFYLIIPLLVWFLNRKQLAAVFVLGILAAPVARHLTGNLGSYVFPWSRADSIFIGGVIAVGLEDPKIRTWLKHHLRAVGALTALLVLGSFVFLVRGHGVGDVLNHFWFGCMYGGMMLVAIMNTGTWLDRVLGNRALVWLGLRSYGVYLFHQPAIGLVDQLALRSISEYAPPLAALLVVLVLAELSFRFFESFFLALGRRLEYGERRN